MIYHFGKPPKPLKPHRTVQKINTPATFYITNGSTADFAFPCWYKEVREPIKKEGKDAYKTCSNFDKDANICKYFNTHCHNVRPTKCRELLDMSSLIPIHLQSEYEETQEYYFETTAETKLQLDEDGDPKVEGLTVISTTIDAPPYDYILRVNFSALCPEAQEEKQECLFTTTIKVDKISKENDDDRTEITRDVALIGRLIVLPAIYHS